MSNKTTKATQRYARLMGDFWRHDRTIGLTPAAAGILTRAWSYAADQMTDGYVPRAILATFFGGAIDDATVDEISASEMWEPAKSGYQLRDWAQRNITREGWETHKAEIKARVAVSRGKKRDAPADVTGDIEPCNTDVTRYIEPCNDPVTPRRRTKDDDDEVLGERASAPETAPKVVESPESPYGRSVSLIRRHWRKRYEAARGTMATNLDDASIATIIEAVGVAGGDFEATLAAALDAYWATDWPRNRANRASLRNFANNLETLLAKPAEPEGDPPDWHPATHGPPKESRNNKRWNDHWNGAST